MATTPETRFAWNGDVHIAYQTVGSGPLDLLLVGTWAHHVEAVWDFPDLAGFPARLSREAAALIPHARYLELSGIDHLCVLAGRRRGASISRRGWPPWRGGARCSSPAP